MKLRSTWMLALLVTLGGCATSHYGRELPLITAEKAAYDCPAIALEIAKCDAFTQSVYDQWSGTKGRRAMGFVMDVGIGDRRERSDALDSADERRTQLTELGASKGCPAPPPAPKDE